jgi:hypothetical protein
MRTCSPTPARRRAVRQLRSVGNPEDGDPRDAFAVLSAAAGLPVEYADKLLAAA